MKLYSSNEHYKLYQGNMLDMLEVIEPNTIDAVITDPPYELNFMNKGWDNSGIAFQKETWQRCYEVLKPGGFLLAFGGSRTFHRIACAIEDAGFEIRDTIMWLYGSGFPKSLNIGLAIDKKNGVESKVVGNGKSGVSSRAYQSEETTTSGEYEIKEAQNKWNGWGTALKPSFEPIIVARKPFKCSLVDNVIEYGVGGINIDECRVGNEKHNVNINDFSNQHGNKWGNGEPIGKLGEREVIGRFPANTILTYDETDFDEVCGGFPYTKDYGGETKTAPNNNIKFNASKEVRITRYNESGSASRYFYCAKASKKDRDEGLDDFEEQYVAASNQAKGELKRGHLDFEKKNSVTWSGIQVKKNIHPTVKPTELMQYLIRLVTPEGGGSFRSF